MLIKSFLLLILLIFSTITLVDYSPLEDQDYYNESKRIISNLNWESQDSTQVKAGWSKANITPDFPAKVVGFGKRSNFEGVLDSLYVRSLVFAQGDRKYLYLAYDLMIVHPLVVSRLENQLAKEELHFDGIYYSATHTHNGIGGYADKLAGWIALGGKDERILDFLVEKSVESIKESNSHLSYVNYYQDQENIKDAVGNRLDKENGKVYSNLNLVYLENKEHKVASILSYSAHATCMPRDYKSISGDYPCKLVDSAEAYREIDFALFSAGPVGSHEPLIREYGDIPRNRYARHLNYFVFSSIVRRNYQPLTKLDFLEIELPLREPHFKILKKFRLRPWLFKLVFGEGKGKLTFLRIGNSCFVATPCDFSGELALEIDEEQKNKNIKTIITSFNGEYIGYITPDKYYDWDRYEVQESNWFGPYNGRYFKESILEVLNKIEK